jgi:hypothetical protein
MPEESNVYGTTTPRSATTDSSSRMSDRGSSGYGDAGQRTTGNGSGIVDRVKDTATRQLTSQKERGTDVLGSVAQAVRTSTQRLRDEKHDTIASYVDRAADRIESWSGRLKEKDVDELVSDLQRLARRQPAVFIGSAFALGLVGARFIKSSAESPDRVYGDSGVDYAAVPPMNQTGGRSTPNRGYEALVETDVLISDNPPQLSDTTGSTRTPGSRSSRTRSGGSDARKDRT